MPKQRIDLRLDPELVQWVDGYGRSMRWDRTTVITAALESFREDVAGGVPELGEAVESRRAPGPVSKGPVAPSAAPPSPRAPRVDWAAKVAAQREIDKGR
jgi:hypothetical protein